MRIRKAAIAGATAFAVAFSGVAAASAETPESGNNAQATNNTDPQDDGTSNENNTDAQNDGTSNENNTDAQDDGTSEENNTPADEAPKTEGDETKTVAKDGQGSSSLVSSKPRRDTDSEGNLINNNDKKDSTLSAKIGGLLEATKPADGRKVFGDDADVSSQPKWAQALYGVGIASIIITILGGLVGPVLNFIKYGPFSK